MLETTPSSHKEKEERSKQMERSFYMVQFLYLLSEILSDQEGI
jgi:hypothetical protein